jgi:CheY-like chemotaxis protein
LLVTDRSIDITLGPLPGDAVRIWVANARRFISALRDGAGGDEVQLPDDVLDAFANYLDQWEASASGDTFVWSGSAYVDLVRRLSAYWVFLAGVANDRAVELRLPVGEPGGEAFSDALLDALSVALEPEADDDFGDKLREAFPTEPHVETAPPKGGPLRVLLVDDTDDIRLLLRVTLGRDDRFEVVGEAADGAAAIRFVEQNGCPDAVLLDLMMPVMDGRTALPLLKELCSRLRVIVLTAKSASEVQDLLDLGAERVLTKNTPLPEIAGALVAA